MFGVLYITTVQHICCLPLALSFFWFYIWSVYEDEGFLQATILTATWIRFQTFIYFRRHLLGQRAGCTYLSCSINASESVLLPIKFTYTSERQMHRMKVFLKVACNKSISSYIQRHNHISRFYRSNLFFKVY